MARVQQHSERYDPAVVLALTKSIERSSTYAMVMIEISQLTDSMVLAQNVVTENNMLLIAKGQETTQSVRRHLQNYNAKDLIGDKVKVFDKSSQ